MISGIVPLVFRFIQGCYSFSLNSKVVTTMDQVVVKETVDS